MFSVKNAYTIYTFDPYGHLKQLSRLYPKREKLISSTVIQAETIVTSQIGLVKSGGCSLTKYRGSYLLLNGSSYGTDGLRSKKRF